MRSASRPPKSIKTIIKQYRSSIETILKKQWNQSASQPTSKLGASCGSCWLPAPWLPAAFCFLLAACCLLLAACCLLLAACCWLLAACCLLLSAACPAAGQANQQPEASKQIQHEAASKQQAHPTVGSQNQQAEASRSNSRQT